MQKSWTEGVFLDRYPMRVLWLVGQARFFCQVNYLAATMHSILSSFSFFDSSLQPAERSFSSVDSVNGITATTVGFIITCTHLQLHWDLYVGLLDEGFWA
jgi:hypothetical protein